MEKINKFKTGDKVMLISGGPNMTVVGYFSNLAKGSMSKMEESETDVECKYFSENEKRFVVDVFHQDTIMVVE